MKTGNWKQVSLFEIGMNKKDSKEILNIGISSLHKFSERESCSLKQATTKMLKESRATKKIKEMSGIISELKIAVHASRWILLLGN